MSLSIATWNVNSVRTRLPHLLSWLREDKPDIVLLQELKCIEEQFPSMEIEELGYNIAVYGEKSYNGVAILSKFPLDDITRGVPGNRDERARYIEAVVTLPKSALRVASIYVPNGSEITSEKFPYKLDFLEKFHAHVKTLLAYQEFLVIGGDYNIAPTDADVHNPKAWEGSVLTHDAVRQAWRKIANLGMYDAQALIGNGQETGNKGEKGTHASGLMPNAYTWWDYRAGAFANDDGLRIDHLLLSPQAADKITCCSVKKHLRELEKPSDHAPVVGIFSILS